MTTACEMLTAALERRGEKPIIERRGVWQSGRETLDHARARAAALSRAGLKPGGMVIILVSDNVWAIETLLGAWLAGGGGCLVDFRTPADRLEEWVRRLQPDLVVGQRQAAGAEVLVLKDVPGTYLPHHPMTPISPDARAICFSSSGTTGLPKLSLRSQAVLAGNVRDQTATLGDPPWSGWNLAAISMAYSAAAFGWILRLTNGQPIVALDLVFRLQDLDRALQRPEISECFLPPHLIRRLTALQETETPRYPHLDVLASVGGPAAPADKVAAVTRLSPGYLLTYSGVGFGRISEISGRDVLDKPGSCGKPVKGIHVEILDGDRVCGPGEPGEIVVARRGTPAARTGDLGWLDAEGSLYVTGRVTGLISRKGVNFPADRIYNAAMEVREVEDAAVIVTADRDGGDHVYLVIQGSGLAAGELRQLIAERLPAAERPDAVHVWPALPRNVAGKVDLRQLSALLSDAELALAADG